MTPRADSVDLAWGSELTREDVFGSPCRMFSTRRHRVVDVLDDAARFGTHTYLVAGETRLTIAALTAAVDDATDRLRALGIRTGDRIMLYGRNCAEWVIGFWAVMRCGAVAVLGNTWWTADELRHAIALATPAAVVCEEQARESFTGLATLGFGQLGTVLTASGPRPGAPPIGEGDPAVVLFTSGTTGRPKGVLLSQRSVLANLQNLLALSRRLPKDMSVDAPPSVTLLSVPLFHIGGVQQLLTSALTGGCLVFTGRRFDGAEVLRTIDREAVKAWAAVPTMVGRVLDARDAGVRADLSSVRVVTLGGAPVPESLRSKVREAFPNAGRGTGVSYGLTEAGGVIAAGAGHDVATHPGTVGRPVPLAEVRVDAAGADGVGEILVRSPTVMDRYLGGDEQDAPFVDGRWLRTGDLGRLDGDGFLYVTGRAKDVIIRGGENILGAVIEEAIARHPDVRQVAVVGVPHADLGEQVAAVATLRAGSSLSHAGLRAHLDGLVAPISVPTVWRVRPDDLPTNAAGKVLKAQLRAELLAELDGGAVG